MKSDNYKNTSSPCQDFRSLLENELLRPGTNAELTSLSWHEHLLSCEACRDLLEAEEALEALLSSLPKPRLPKHLVRRVLMRLEHARTHPGLDQLLDADLELPVPNGLSGRLLSGLAGSRGDGLDRLLDQYEVEAETGLAGRVLANLEEARSPAPLQFYEHPLAKVLLATAAAVIVYIGAYKFSSGDAKGVRSNTELAFADPDLLEEYYLLDNWNLLMPEADVELLIATSIDSAEELALGMEEVK